MPGSGAGGVPGSVGGGVVVEGGCVPGLDGVPEGVPDGVPGLEGAVDVPGTDVLGVSEGCVAFLLPEDVLPEEALLVDVLPEDLLLEDLVLESALPLARGP